MEQGYWKNVGIRERFRENKLAHQESKERREGIC